MVTGATRPRILALLAYLLRRVPQCGDFFAHRLGAAEGLTARSKATADRKKMLGEKPRGPGRQGSWGRQGGVMVVELVDVSGS